MSLNSKRNRAAQALMKHHAGLFAQCHWCKTVIVWLQKLTPEQIVKDSNSSYVRFTHGNKTFHLPKVTVDHVKELSKGGSNHLSNLVPSCMKCNTSRSNPPHEKYKFCVECGKRKNGRSRRRCKACSDKGRRLHAPLHHLSASSS